MTRVLIRGGFALWTEPALNVGIACAVLNKIYSLSMIFWASQKKERSVISQQIREWDVFCSQLKLKSRMAAAWLPAVVHCRNKSQPSQNVSAQPLLGTATP